MMVKVYGQSYVKMAINQLIMLKKSIFELYLYVANKKKLAQEILVVTNVSNH